MLPDRNRKAEQERSALLVEHGRVVVSFGGLAGDCDNYVGYVTSTSVAGSGRTFHYAVPTAREAGMWSPAGPVLGPQRSRLRRERQRRGAPRPLGQERLGDRVNNFAIFHHGNPITHFLDDTHFMRNDDNGNFIFFINSFK